jgi:RNase P subunit RPR2
MAMQKFEEDDLTSCGKPFDPEATFCDRCLAIWNSGDLNIRTEDGGYTDIDRLCKRCLEKFRREMKK